jgi:hypothetical protein
MEKFEDISDLLFVVAPLLVVMGGFYLLVKKMFDRDYKIKLIESKRMLQKEVLPIRLQAYERVTLFLERISPESIIVRTIQPDMTVRELQQQLIATIRNEYEHNITQQVYISAQAWQMVKNAKEDITRIINTASGECNHDGRAIELSTKIFEVMLRNQEMPSQQALTFLKSEAQQSF